MRHACSLQINHFSAGLEKKRKKNYPMGHKTFSSSLSVFFCMIFLINPFTHGQLDYHFYDASCPKLAQIVRWGVWAAIRNDTRMAASLLRLHFHDCFVNGCDGSVLLDDAANFKSEKNAFPNRNSVRGFEVIDSIKADVERVCPWTVSCVDILALAAREAVLMAGGPYWPVYLGRRDGLTASEKAANEQLPSPLESLDNIAAKFVSKGLDLKDTVVLSGAHTIGFAQCFTFKRRLFDFKGSGRADPSLDASLLSNLKTICPNVDGSNSKLAPLDVQTNVRFDNAYYKNLMSNTGLLESDQALMDNPKTAEMVRSYSTYPYLYFQDFAASMVKLSYVGILTGQAGEIRKFCGSVNS